MEEGSDAAVREYVYDRLVFRAACSAAVCAVVAPQLTAARVPSSNIVPQPEQQLFDFVKHNRALGYEGS
jgi:hypothetical protein